MQGWPGCMGRGQDTGRRGQGMGRRGYDAGEAWSECRGGVATVVPRNLEAGTRKGKKLETDWKQA